MSTKSKKAKKGVKLNSLSKSTKALAKGEMKKVKGGGGARISKMIIDNNSPSTAY